MNNVTTSKSNNRNTPAVMNLRASDKFVETPSVGSITQRAIAYVAAGYPVHFRGPAGAGKTTLALHVAMIQYRTAQTGQAWAYGVSVFGTCITNDEPARLQCRQMTVYRRLGQVHDARQFGQAHRMV